jgi:hypothetical protein
MALKNWHTPHSPLFPPLSTKQLGLFMIVMGIAFAAVFIMLMWLLYNAHG